MLVAVTAFAAKPARVASPDGRLVLEADGTSYSLVYDGKTIVSQATAGIELEGIATGAVRKAKVGKKVTEHIKAPFYRQAEFDFCYTPLVITFKSGLVLEWRVTDEGAAYRWVYNGKAPAVVKREIVTLPFSEHAKAWLPLSDNERNPFDISFESTYTERPLGGFGPQPAFLPATVEAAPGIKVTVLESDLEAYPGMFVRAHRNRLEGVWAPYPAELRKLPRWDQLAVARPSDHIAECAGTRSFPWRILAVTTDDVQMPVNNLVYALAEPSRLDDTSWIKPGFTAWDWWNDWNLRGVDFEAGINNETYKYYIDFASANGIEYVILDEGWSDTAAGDLLVSIPEIDIAELVRYGASKNVGIVLWSLFMSLDKNREEVCRRYSEMGVAGFKVDFLNRDDQKAVEMVYRVAETAAKYHLILDFHGIYKPTGINRTFPNILNFEAVYGQENVRWQAPEVDMPRFDVTYPFIRQMTGYSDYTPGAMVNATRHYFAPIYRKPMSKGTRAHQVGLYVVIDSPFTMLCDSPSNYMKEQETVDFITSLPRYYEETKVISGKMGEYIVTARRSGDTWYVGGLCNWDARDVEVDFSFLCGGEWEASLFKDGVNAGHNAEDYAIEHFQVTPSTRKTVHFASGGGFCMIIKK